MPNIVSKYNSKNYTIVVSNILNSFKIIVDYLGYFTIDNTTINNSYIQSLIKKYNFNKDIYYI